jgi:hypothetical protein
MSGYTKVFDSMLTSSIWEEPHETFRVWMTMLLMANRNGVVDASVPGLARYARVTLEQCQQALAVLSGPDQFSRTPDREGRRIEPVDGGWHLVNHAKYREKLGAEERREYKREREHDRRERLRTATAAATTARVVRGARGESVDTRGQT